MASKGIRSTASGAESGPACRQVRDVDQLWSVTILYYAFPLLAPGLLDKRAAAAAAQEANSPRGGGWLQQWLPSGGAISSVGSCGWFCTGCCAPTSAEDCCQATWYYAITTPVCPSRTSNTFPIPPDQADSLDDYLPGVFWDIALASLRSWRSRRL
jgi:hypothetical protein